MSDVTIAAIATAAGNSGIGIVRMSGRDSFEIADRVYRSVSGNFSIKDAADHTIHYGYIYDGDELIDEVLISVFFAPRSFTAENTVEISCHGGYYVTKKILSVLLKNGAKIAAPGEFTKRAFLNGRLNLSQAEAVIDIINAKNDFALRNSLSQLGGSIREKIAVLREDLLNETAFIESALDDPEHFSLEDHHPEMKRVTDSVKKGIEDIIAKSSNAGFLKNGINTLILGKPNAGKSSLLNALIGYDRAIVTDVAGTTRDTIEESVSLDGIVLNLIDTAGIREGGDEVEKLGINRALSLIDKADLVLYVMDICDEIDEDDKKIAASVAGKKVVVIFNKSDIGDEARVKSLEAFAAGISDLSVVISAKTGEGIDELSDIIQKLFMLSGISFDEDIYITNERQLDCMNRALSSMKLVCDALNDGISEDFITIDLMDAYSALGEILGEQLSDDLADRIFERFCMGK